VTSDANKPPVTASGMFHRVQRRDTAVEAGAAEEHDDGDREGKRIGRLKGGCHFQKDF
jgi:hypothetical protein